MKTSLFGASALVLLGASLVGLPSVRSEVNYFQITSGQEKTSEEFGAYYGELKGYSPFLVGGTFVDNYSFKDTLKWDNSLSNRYHIEYSGSVQYIDLLSSEVDSYLTIYYPKGYRSLSEWGKRSTIDLKGSLVFDDRHFFGLCLWRTTAWI